jgi:hypothetical protein
MLLGGDASLGQEFLNIPVTQIEPVVEPDCVTNDVRGDPITLISIPEPILSIGAT